MAPGSSSSDTGLQSGVCWTSPVCGADRSPSPGRRCGGAGGDSGAGRGHWPSLAPPVPAHCLLGPFPPRPTRHQIKTRFTHSLKAPELPSGEFLRGCCTLGPHPAGLPTSGLPQAAGRSAGPETVLGTGPVGPASALLWLTASQVSKEKTPQGVSPVPVAAVGRPPRRDARLPRGAGDRRRVPLPGPAPRWQSSRSTRGSVCACASPSLSRSLSRQQMPGKNITGENTSLSQVNTAVNETNKTGCFPLFGVQL